MADQPRSNAMRQFEMGRLPLAAAIALVFAASQFSATPLAARQPQPAPNAAEHLRVLPLQGGNNFRDLGGYRTTDGRTTRWGLLYRSGAMNNLTPADFATLARLGIRTVCDLRDKNERAAQAVAWPAASAPRVLADDYTLDMRALAAVFGGAAPTGESARAAMASSYPAMLGQFNGQYRRMFAELLAGEAPLAFNCSAGKDRTGIAAALLLTALGVPREAVIEDYLLSNRYFDPAKMGNGTAGAAAYQRLPPDVLKAIMGVDRSYIDAVFAAMDAHKGGVDAYLADALGLGRAERRELVRLYTERSTR